jgi:hypothetical protein
LGRIPEHLVSRETLKATRETSLPRKVPALQAGPLVAWYARSET